MHAVSWEFDVLERLTERGIEQSSDSVEVSNSWTISERFRLFANIFFLADIPGILVGLEDDLILSV